MKLVQVFDLDILPHDCIEWLNDEMWDYGILFYKWFPNRPYTRPEAKYYFELINKTLKDNGMIVDELPETYVLLDRYV